MLGFLGTADAALQSTVNQIESYFTDNIGIVVGLFVACALFVWLLSIAIRSVGARRPNKVG